MIFQRLEIVNIRQLHGEASIKFAPPGKKNVTVFVAENAGGKSTMLYALRWC